MVKVAAPGCSMNLASPEREVSDNRRAMRRFLLVFLFSLVVRLLAAYVLRDADFRSDAKDYVHVAHQLAGGESFYPYWPPGLPLYLAPFVAAGANGLTLRLAMLPFWGACCWGLYRLTKTFGVHRYAWVLLLVFSLLPDSVEYAIEPLTQMPVAAFLLLSISALASILRQGRALEYLLLGASLGAMTLTRPSGAPLILLMPLCALWLRRQTLFATGTALLACGIAASWLVRVHQMTGVYVFNSANAVNLYYGNNPWTPLYKTWYFGSHAKLGTQEIERFPAFQAVMDRVEHLSPQDSSHEFQRLATEEIRSHPGRFLLRTANRVRCFFGFDSFTGAGLAGVRWGRLPFAPPVLALEAITYCGLLLSSIFWLAQAPYRFWKDPLHIMIATACCVYAVPYWLSMSHPTYHFPIVLPIAALGAAAWQYSSQTETRSYIRGWIAAGAFLLLQFEWVAEMMSHTP